MEAALPGLVGEAAEALKELIANLQEKDAQTHAACEPTDFAVALNGGPSALHPICRPLAVVVPTDRSAPGSASSLTGERTSRSRSRRLRLHPLRRVDHRRALLTSTTPRRGSGRSRPPDR